MTRVDELFDELKDLEFSKEYQEKHKEFGQELSRELNNKNDPPTPERKTELFEKASLLLNKSPKHKPKSDAGVRKDEGFKSYDPNADRYHIIGGTPDPKKPTEQNISPDMQRIIEQDYNYDEDDNNGPAVNLQAAFDEVADEQGQGGKRKRKTRRKKSLKKKRKTKRNKKTKRKSLKKKKKIKRKGG